MSLFIDTTVLHGRIVWVCGSGGVTPGNFAGTSFSNPENYATINDFAEYLENNFTDARASWLFYGRQDYPISFKPGPWVNGDRLAIIVMQNTDTGTITRLSIPAPKASVLYSSSQGERVTPAALMGLGPAFSSATDKNFIARWGYVVQKI